MTVTTVFSGATDGWIDSSDGNSDTYSTARAGGTFTVDTAATTFRAGQSHTAGKVPHYNCYEGFLQFDTSAISDSDVVSIITLDLWLTTDGSTTDFTLEARERDWGASLTSGDYVAGASLSGLTLMASIASSGIGATGAYKTLTSQTAFLTATNLKTGTVFLLMDSDRQVSNTAPGSTTIDESLTFSSADNTGTTQDPKLTITSAPGLARPFSTSKPMRIWRNY